MALIWPTHLLDPLPIGGAGRCSAHVYSDSGGVVEAVAAVLAPAPGSTPSSPPLDGAVLQLNPPLGGGLWLGTFWDAHGCTSCSWFAKVGGVWVPGPVDACALPFVLDSDLPLPLKWVVSRVRDFAAGRPPFAGKDFVISGSYPRDVSAWPMASCQVDDISLVGQVTRNLLASTGSMVGSDTSVFGSAYNVTVSITCWCATPEDRTVLTSWLACALEAVRLCAASFDDFATPTFSLSESEDFETLGIPAFLAVGRITGTVWSRVSAPVSQTSGRVTVP